MSLSAYTDAELEHLAHEVHADDDLLEGQHPRLPDHEREPVTSAVAHVAHVAHPDGERATDTARILDQVDALLSRYVAFPSDEARWAVAAWVMHAWVVDAFDSTPRLALLSPEKGSGKTRTLEVVELVVPKPMHTVNISAAALFRMIEQGPVTLLLDEADTYLGFKVSKEHEDLRGLVNAGHRRGAVAFRCELGGKNPVVKEFPAFAPVALAGIGDLPDTILDRSVVVAMRRRSANEVVAPFRRRNADREVADLVDWLQWWATENLDVLTDAEPVMPPGITDRPADVWEPLVIIGDHASGVWSDRLRRAAVVLNQARQERDPSLGVQLLSDCRDLFADRDRFSTDELLERLVAIDERPWGDLRGKPLDARGLARRLRPFDVRPGDHRFGETTRKGYLRSDFHDAWSRYLPPVAHVAFGDGGEVDNNKEAPALPPAEEGQQGQHGQPDLFDTDAFEAEHGDLFL